MFAEQIVLLLCCFCIFTVNGNRIESRYFVVFFQLLDFDARCNLALLDANTFDIRTNHDAIACNEPQFLIIVDDIARLATAGEIPLGILTAFVGAPIFLYLILTGGARRGD